MSTKELWQRTSDAAVKKEENGTGLLTHLEEVMTALPD